MGHQSKEEIDHVFIDLDETLYTCPYVVRFMIKEIERIMTATLGIPEEETPRLCRELCRDYGTTLAGLVAKGYRFDVDRFQSEVHNFEDGDACLRPDRSLKEMLMRLDRPKYIFTNGTLSHAKRCLKVLDMEDVFEDIICFDSLMQQARDEGIDIDRRIVCKPHPEAFTMALKSTGASPKRTLFVDDSRRNIETAKQMGIETLLVHPDANDANLQPVAKSLKELPLFFPDLFLKD